MDLSCACIKPFSNYLLTAKSWAGQLAAIGKAVDDEDLISYVVGGLNSSYHPFITSLSFATRDVPISFDAFQIELLNFEYLLESHVKFVLPESNQVAFFTQKSKQQYYNKKTKFQQYPNQRLHPPQQQRLIFQTPIPEEYHLLHLHDKMVNLTLQILSFSMLIVLLVKSVERQATRPFIVIITWISHSKADIHHLN